MSLQINHQYFLVEIDKKAQTKKRQNVTAVERPWLGLNGYDAKDKGVMVVSAQDGSPAAAAGFVSGDNLWTMNGEPIQSFAWMIEQVWKMAPGDTVTFEYQGVLSLVPHTKTVTLGAKVPTLVRDESQNDMVYNLQYGTIRMMGGKACQEFPEASLGDVLIFNHKVEYKERTTGDSTFADWHLVEVLPNGNELRIVDYSHECYGVLKLGKANAFEIIPFRKTIFCHQHIRPAQMLQRPDGLYLPDAWEVAMAERESKLEELQLQIQEISQSTILTAKTTDANYDRKEAIFKQIARINRERQYITKKMSETKLVDVTVVFINPNTAAYLKTPIKSGDTLTVNYGTLYPLDFGGACYTLVHADYVELHKEKVPEVALELA